jgi:hypothetical protein
MTLDAQAALFIMLGQAAERAACRFVAMTMNTTRLSGFR